MPNPVASIVPSSAQPIADARGIVTVPYQRFFNALVAAAAPIQTIVPTASPYTFTASAYGSLAISGGTVSAVSLSRSGTTAATGITAGLIPMANGDSVTITYSGAPTLAFVPA